MSILFGNVIYELRQMEHKILLNIIPCLIEPFKNDYL